MLELEKFLAEGIYEKHLIDCGAAIGALICEQLSDGKLEQELLEWYQAASSVKSRYHFLQKHSPHRVYVTLDDLGKNLPKWQNANKLRIVSQIQEQVMWNLLLPMM